MITCRQDYYHFLAEEFNTIIPCDSIKGRCQYFIFALRHTLFCHPLPSFHFYLRLYEYLYNDNHAIMRRGRLIWAKRNYSRLSVKCSMSIPINCFDVGLRLPHYGGIIVNGHVKVGRNCSIRPFTVIGNKGDGKNEEVPQIGDDVTIGCNCSIIGNVRIGNKVTIGAGSVVVHHVPDKVVVAGNPAVVIKHVD